MDHQGHWHEHGQPQGLEPPPPRPGQPPQPPAKASLLKRFLVLFGVAVVVLVVGVVGIAFMASAASKAGNAAERAFDQAVQGRMDAAMQKVANDAVAQYELVKQNDGGVMQLCVQAGMVKAAMIQAQDAAGIRRWSATERADCARAGVPIE